MASSTKAEKGDISSASRGGRLARRARSFKEDFFGKISHMRTPGGQRSSSPHKKSKGSGKGLSVSPNAAGASGDSVDGGDKRKGEKDVDCVLYHVNQLGKSLSYLDDTVRKGIPDMLPGAITIIFDTVMNIQSSLRKCSPALSDQSSELLSATNQVYQSLAALVRVSDEIFLQSNENSKESVAVMVKNVREAVQSLVQLCMDKQQNKENSRLSSQSPVSAAVNGFCSPKADKKETQDASLEVPLTPREREILEQTSVFSLPAMPSPDPKSQQRTPLLHHSASSDSILSSTCTRESPANGVTGPPPKPPFPIHQGSLDSATLKTSLGFVEAPPLPPKKKSGGMFLTAQCKTEQLLTSGSSLWTTDNNSVPVGPTSMNGSLCQQTAGFFLENRLTDMTLSPAFDLINSLRNSPESLSLSKSSVCSLDSNLNHSADDLLMMGSSSRSRLFHQSSTTSTRVSNSSGASTSIEGAHQSYSFSTSSKKTTVSYSLSSSTGNSIDDLAQQSAFMSGVNGGGGSQELGSIPSVHLSSSSPPPALPAKMRAGRGRAMSQYDNVPQLVMPDSEPESGRGSMEEDHCQLRHSQSMFHYPGCLQSSQTLPSGGQLCPRFPPAHFGSCNALEDGKPPPLPPKKKNIMAYMQTFGSYSQPAEGEFFRHSLTTYQMIQAQWHEVELMTTILQQQQHHQHHTTTSSSAASFAASSIVSSSDDSVFSRSSHESWDQSLSEEDLLGQVSPNAVPPALPPKKNRISSGKLPESPPCISNTSPVAAPKTPVETKALTLPEGENNLAWSKEGDDLTKCALDEIGAEDYLIFKQPDEEGLDVRGGSVDALISHTTRIPLNKDGKTCSNFLYLEAFLTTYRTFVSPYDLIQKLIYRHNRFIHMQDRRKHIARNAFGVIVQIVDDLCLSELDSSLVGIVMDFIQVLVSGGELPQAKVLHMRLVDKFRQQRQEVFLASQNSYLCQSDVSTQQALLLDFKSEHLAEQMTLLDAQLFQRIEIPEVLLYAREQKEELSPNLTKFTEHFNNMSYWARSRILEQEEPKERERFVVKFIKIMKCLRKLKNFNSYLAILSALDSAPIRRLEWQRNITEGLKEYCALIDSSSSFRAYRLALAETQPPCIPYIGLILQDLTFVHIGNSDLLPDGNINFAKRWQQFNILQNMKRFRKCQYTFKKDEQIVAFFNNFGNYLCEESMWQISESIKPRGGKKKQDS